MDSRELVLRTLEFRNASGRVPRQLWTLPWACEKYPQTLEKLARDFVWDFDGPVVRYARLPQTQGDPYAIGEYVDEWGCTFTNVHGGVIGEVKAPLVGEDDWSDANRVHIPEEWLSFDVAQVNASCREKREKFLMAGCCPRPFEQLQFIRGTANLYMDLLDPPPRMLAFLEKMHDFYCRLLRKWAQTEVDALNFMDDWGSQNDLLISPALWDRYFRPMYRDYIDIAHAHGKKIFMHSDGNTLRILPRLIDLGLDAFNTQIFCIGIDKLAPFKGKITFWGEIDRQHLIPSGTPREIDAAIQGVYDTLWQDGGLIAQCEFGAGANPDNVYRIYQKWREVRAGKAEDSR